MSAADNPPFQRLFVALPVPPEFQAVIGRAQAKLKRASPPGAVRWGRPGQFHMTLKFLGDILSAQLPALQAALAGACAGFETFEVAAGGIGFFPNARSPRVIWAGVSDDGKALNELHRRIHAAVLPFAPADVGERFAGHITLGRIRPGRQSSLKRIFDRLAALRDAEFGRWTADRVELLRSELTPDGARHEVVAAFGLEPKPDSI